MCCVWFSRTGLSVRVTLLACSCSRAIFTAGQHSVTLPLHTVWSYQWQIFWLFAILQLHTQERKGWAWGLCTFNFLSNASFAVSHLLPHQQYEGLLPALPAITAAASYFSPSGMGSCRVLCHCSFKEHFAFGNEWTEAGHLGIPFRAVLPVSCPFSVRPPFFPSFLGVPYLSGIQAYAFSSTLPSTWVAFSPPSGCCQVAESVFSVEGSASLLRNVFDDA